MRTADKMQRVRAAKTVLPASDLQDYLRRQAALLDGGMFELCTRIALGLGERKNTTNRRMWRLMHQDQVSLDAADKILTALGVHVADIYGWDWY